MCWTRCAWRRPGLRSTSGQLALRPQRGSLRKAEHKVSSVCNSLHIQLLHVWFAASGAEGHRFESCRARHFVRPFSSKRRAFFLGIFCFWPGLAIDHVRVRSGHACPKHTPFEHQRLGGYTGCLTSTAALNPTSRVWRLVERTVSGRRGTCPRDGLRLDAHADPDVRPAIATPTRGRTLLRERPLNILDNLDVLGSATHREQRDHRGLEAPRNLDKTSIHALL